MNRPSRDVGFNSPRRSSQRPNESTGCSSERASPSRSSKKPIASSPRIVRPAWREAQVANVHQFAPVAPRAASSAASSE